MSRICFLGKEKHKLGFGKCDAEENIWAQVGENGRNYNVNCSSKNIRFVTWGRLRSGTMLPMWESVQMHTAIFDKINMKKRPLGKLGADGDKFVLG